MKKIFTSLLFFSAYCFFVLAMTFLWSQYEEDSPEEVKSSAEDRVESRVENKKQAIYFFNRNAKASVENRLLSRVSLSGISKIQKSTDSKNDTFQVELFLRDRLRGSSSDLPHQFPFKIIANLKYGAQGFNERHSLTIEHVSPSKFFEEAKSIVQDLEAFIIPDLKAGVRKEKTRRRRDRLGTFIFVEEFKQSPKEGWENQRTFIRRDKKYTQSTRKVEVLAFKQIGKREKDSPWLLELKSSQVLKTKLTQEKNLLIESSFSLKEISGDFASTKLARWKRARQDHPQKILSTKPLIEDKWSYWAEKLSKWEERESLADRRDLFLGLRDAFKKYPDHPQAAADWLLAKKNPGRIFEVIIGAMSSAGGRASESALISIYEALATNKKAQESVVMGLNTFKGGLSESGQDFLIQEYEENEAIRETAGLALGSSHRKNPSAQVRGFLKDEWKRAKAKDQKSALIDYVGNSGDESMSDLIAEASSSSNSSLRREAAYATRWMDGASSLEILLKLTADSDSRTRKEAFRAMLYRSWNASFKEPLFRCLKKERKSSVRIQCVQALIQHREESPDITPALEDIFHESDPGTPVHLALRQWLSEEAS